MGYCNDKKKNCFLVYDYTQILKLNLSHFLFGDVTKPLSWTTRLRIMIGVARGLTYLHSSKEQVIHGGSKTFNILLDKNFNAKLGHFGLAKGRPKFHESDTSTRDMDTLRYFDKEDRLNGICYIFINSG
ncbi:unnamed protein product [Lactuca saligna]|uniref:Protein kinase domain-containing protein n=1 Tax=Lactuca saligna TaxID=75948 RepID=A0AA36A3V2_LACSI|nr:unnamed protein product [Lactuca saligna]